MKTRLEVMLEERGFTVTSFARAIGIPQPTLYRIVSGESRMSGVTVGNFMKIAHGLGMSVEELYFDEPNYSHDKNTIDTVFTTTTLAGRRAMVANALGVESTYTQWDGKLLPFPEDIVL